MKGKKRMRRPELARQIQCVRDIIGKSTLSPKLKSALTTFGLSLILKEAGKDGTPITKGCSPARRAIKPSATPVTTPKPKKKIKNGKLIGGDRIITHSANNCAGDHCPLHKPSDHKMVSWDMYLRWDRGLLIERICPKHGIGHPDPDSLAWINRNGIVDHGTHGCCGCCN